MSILDHPFLCLSRQQALFKLANNYIDSTNNIVGGIILFLRANQLNQAEAAILLSPRIENFYQLLLLLRIYQEQHDCINRILSELDSDDNQNLPLILFARQRIALKQQKPEQVLKLSSSIPNSLESCWNKLLFAQANLWLGNVDSSRLTLSSLPNDFIPNERLEVSAHLHLADNKPDQCLALLSPLIEAGEATSMAWELAIHCLGLIGNDQSASTMLNRALVLFPKSYRLMSRDVIKSVLSRQPIKARRLSLLERLYAPSERPSLDIFRSNSNLFYAYENGGRADFLRHRHVSIVSAPQSLADRANSVLQLASLADPSYSEIVSAASESLIRHPFVLPLKKPKSTSKLRVGFISPDFHYHPVGRFFAMQLYRNLGSGGDLHAISIAGRTDTTTELIHDLVRQQGTWHDLREQSLEKQLVSIRNLNLDVAVDLSGWTAGAAPSIFASRIAPVQVNYLGFFASSGLAEMDYWLGDPHLFPSPIHEWHSEKIYRMPRCFLAWQPFHNLPEGRVAIPAPPNSNNIVFGSFNHVRKLGKSTLTLWGQILKSIPNSRLALKAYTSDDPGTILLLERRMNRCGLDPSRVIWLPTPNASEDHLQQYGSVDVSLDPFPNGGCTTTCESLWMGVPVITLSGDHYVSRMSTAVLQGADLSEWIASNEHEYLSKAIRASKNLSQIRSSRATLREHVSKSSLGNIPSLNSSLWSSFANMYSQTAES